MTATATAPTNGAHMPPAEFPLAARAIAEVGVARHRAMPESIEEKLRMAEGLIRSGMLPKVGRKDSRREMTVEEVAVILQLGDELGLAPMQACQGIAVVEGRPCPMYQTKLSVVQKSGKLENYSQVWSEDGTSCTVTAKRVGNPTPVTTTFTMADATRAGITGNPMWSKYPRDMLRNRAGDRTLKIAFADVLAGIPLEDELEAEAAERAERQAAAWTVPAAEFSELKRLIAASGMKVDALGDLVRSATGAELARDAAGKVNFDALTLASRAAWSQILEGVRAHARSRPAGAKAPARPTIAEPAKEPVPAPPFARVQDLAGQYGFRGEADLASACEITQ